MSTVLSLVQQALYEMGIQPPSTLLTATNQEQLKLKALLYAESRYLRSQANWVRQKRTFTLALSSGRSRYPLPQNFYAPISETGWDDDLSIPLYGPEGDSEFAAKLYGVSGQASFVSYRPFGPDGAPSDGTSGGQLQVFPTPTATKNVVLEYYSSDLFLPPYWSASEAGITTAKYRFCNGLILDCTAITTGTTDTTPPTAAGVDGGVTWAVITTPYEAIIADEDQTVFDDDVVIAGIKWRYLKSQNMDYSLEAEEYKRLLNTALTRFMGSFKGSFAGNHPGPRYRIPSGSWSL